MRDWFNLAHRFVHYDALNTFQAKYSSLDTVKHNENQVVRIGSQNLFCRLLKKSLSVFRYLKGVQLQVWFWQFLPNFQLVFRTRLLGRFIFVTLILFKTFWTTFHWWFGAKVLCTDEYAYVVPVSPAVVAHDLHHFLLFLKVKNRVQLFRI